jgi:hypothetical protein
MEHLNFLKAFRAFGRDWLAIARYVETKDEDQIRSHGQVFINKVRANGKKLKEVLDSFDLSDPRSIPKEYLGVLRRVSDDVGEIKIIKTRKKIAKFASQREREEASSVYATGKPRSTQSSSLL